MRKLYYYSHLLLNNYNVIYIFYTILFFIILNINQDQSVIYCNGDDVSSLKIANNQMEKMLMDCEINKSVHYKIITKQHALINYQEEQIKLQKIDLQITQAIASASFVIIIGLLIRIAFFK